MSNDKSDFSPAKVLKIYKQSGRATYYMEMHNVVSDGKNGRKLGSGRPLTQAMMRGLISASHLKESETDSYFSSKLMDPRIISFEPLKFKRHVIWYDKPGVRKLIFSKSMKMKDGYYALPGMLYILHMNRFRVFAIRTGNRRPVLDTKLYYAPLFNTIGDFQFCWGSVRANSEQQLAIDSEIKMWDGFLWDSKWSHSQHDYEKALKATKGGTVRFNTKLLTPAGMTLGDAINKYI